MVRIYLLTRRSPQFKIPCSVRVHCVNIVKSVTIFVQTRLICSKSLVFDQINELILMISCSWHPLLDRFLLRQHRENYSQPVRKQDFRKISLASRTHAPNPKHEFDCYFNQKVTYAYDFRVYICFTSPLLLQTNQRKLLL